MPATTPLLERDSRNRDLQERNAQLATASAAARADFESADAAVGGAAAAALLRAPGGRALSDPVRRAILTQSRDYYRGFLARNADRPELAVALAFAAVKQAEAEFALGNDAAVPALHDDARRRFARVLAERPGDPEAEYGTAVADMQTAAALVYQLKPGEARPFVVRACEAFARLCEQPQPKLARFVRLETPAGRLAAAAVVYRDLEVNRDPRRVTYSATGVETTENVFVGWARKAEAALRSEGAGAADAPPDVRAALARIELALGEEAVGGGRTDEGEVYLRAAGARLAAVLAGIPTEANELELPLHIVGAYQALILRRRGLARDAERETIRVRDRFAELARRPWGVDENGVRDRVRLFAGLSSQHLGDWARDDGDAAKANAHYRAALDAYDEVATDPGRFELSLRLAVYRNCEQIVIAGSRVKLDPRLTADAIDRCRGHLAALGPELKDVPWFRRQKAFLDIQYANFLQEHSGETALPLTERATRELGEYTRQHPEDEWGLAQYATALFTRGTARIVSGSPDDGMADLVAARTSLVRKWTDPAVREQAAKLRRMGGLMIARVSYLWGTAALAAMPPDRAKARAAAAAGLGVLKESETESGPLTNDERQIRGELDTIRRRAGE